MRQASSRHGDNAAAADTPAADSPLESGLIEEGTKKSGLVWLEPTVERTGTGAIRPARAVWHVWSEGAMHLVVDGEEQPLPEVVAGDLVRVIVRSKDTGGRLLAWRGRVSEILPDTDEWRAVIPALHANRLNHVDGERQPERWAAESRVLRVDPVGRPDELIAADDLPHDAPMPRDSGAAAPRPSVATTVTPRANQPRRRRGRTRRDFR